MTENPEGIWKDCNCMNCRLARIEDSLKKITEIMDSMPAQSEKSV